MNYGVFETKIGFLHGFKHNWSLGVTHKLYVEVTAMHMQMCCCSLTVNIVLSVVHEGLNLNCNWETN